MDAKMYHRLDKFNVLIRSQNFDKLGVTNPKSR